jgi:outer membrane immunogenic protein
VVGWLRKKLGEKIMRRSLVLAATCAIVSVQVASAADLPTKAPPRAPVLPIAYNWAGFYVGGNVGYGWTNIDSTAFNTAGDLAGTSSQDRRGIFGGGQIGYNFMIDPIFLVGVEGDFDWADLTGSSDSCSATGCSHSDGKTSWFATARGRLGYVMNNWLIFATGGAAWTHSSSVRTITASINNPGVVGEVATGTSTHPGWTFGGGVEYGFAPRWSAVLEYLYIQTSGSTDFTYPTATADRHVDSIGHLNTVRLGVNYHFN